MKVNTYSEYMDCCSEDIVGCIRSLSWGTWGRYICIRLGCRPFAILKRKLNLLIVSKTITTFLMAFYLSQTLKKVSLPLKKMVPRKQFRDLFLKEYMFCHINKKPLFLSI